MRDQALGGELLDPLAEAADVVGAPDRRRRDAVLSGEGRQLGGREARGGLAESAAAVDDDDRAAALDDLGLGVGVDAAVADRLDVGHQPADAVRVVPAQVRFHE